MQCVNRLGFDNVSSQFLASLILSMFPAFSSILMAALLRLRLFAWARNDGDNYGGLVSGLVGGIFRAIVGGQTPPGTTRRKTTRTDRLDPVRAVLAEVLGGDRPLSMIELLGRAQFEWVGVPPGPPRRLAVPAPGGPTDTVFCSLVVKRQTLE
jgi:hypothetical protein